MPVRCALQRQQRAWLGVLLVAISSTPALAPRRAFTLPSAAGLFGSVRPLEPVRSAPLRLRLGLAPDMQTDVRDVQWPPRPSFTREARVVVRAPTDAAFSRGSVPVVLCPMPVGRRDTSAVPTMPRLDAPDRDPGGVVVPSCVNSLDLR